MAIEAVGLGFVGWGIWRAWRGTGDQRSLLTGKQPPGGRLRISGITVSGEPLPPPPRAPWTTRGRVAALRRDVDRLERYWLEDRTDRMRQAQELQDEISVLRGVTVSEPRARSLADARMAFGGLALAIIGLGLQALGTVVSG